MRNNRCLRRCKRCSTNSAGRSRIERSRSIPSNCPQLQPAASHRVECAEVRAMAMFGRKSRPSRRRTNQPAWMTIDGSFATRPCTIVDISEGGARLRVEDAQFLKPQFHLKFDRASPGRACKVAWKKGDLVGIKFV